MEQTSFQNGFICGMAAHGLVRSGELYKPTIYNDSGVYSYFYIDFRRTLQAFSLGMWNESLIIYDSVQIPATQVEQVGATLYKIYCDITNKIHGITVLNKKTTRLKFATGELLPVFSAHMFIEGQTAYIDGAYIYDRGGLGTVWFENLSEKTGIDLWTAFNAGSLYESMSMPQISFAASDSLQIILT